MDDETEVICGGCCAVVPADSVDPEGYCDECSALHALESEDDA